MGEETERLRETECGVMEYSETARTPRFPTEFGEPGKSAGSVVRQGLEKRVERVCELLHLFTTADGAFPLKPGCVAEGTPQPAF